MSYRGQGRGKKSATGMMLGEKCGDPEIEDAPALAEAVRGANIEAAAGGEARAG